MPVSIVIASRNEGELLKKTIDGILNSKNHTAYECIIVDDHSMDNSAAFLLTDEYRHMKHLRTTGLGLARARNAGAALATNNILLFCDAHIAVPDYWLDNLMAVMITEKADAVCPNIADIKADAPSQWQQVERGVNDDAIYSGMCGKTIVTLTESRWLPLQPSAFEVPVLPGGCFAVMKTAFEAVGGYDDGLRTYGWDEEEISLKLWTFGFVLKAVPQVTIKHRFRAAMPYTVHNEDMIYNLIHLAMCHYNDRRVALLMGELIPLFPKCFHLYEQAFSLENIQNKRHFYQLMRRYDDDWFFSRFGIEV